MGYRRYENEEFLTGYVRKLDDKELQKLGIMFKQNLNGDKRRICEFLSANLEMDDWLATSANCQDLYDMVSLVGEYVREEHRRRQDMEGDRKDRNGRRDTVAT